MSALDWSLIAAITLAALHFLADVTHGAAARNPLVLSAGGGFSLAYVVVHLLPELASSQQSWLQARPERALDWLESQVYLAVLVGVLIALGFDRSLAGVRRFKARLAWLAVDSALLGGFTAGLVGASQTLLAAFAFGSMLLVNDFELASHYPADFHRVGRWVLAAAGLVGWFGAMASDLSPVAYAILVGLLSGGAILDIVKTQVHTDPRRRLRTFVAAALAYAGLVLAFKYSVYQD
jgi:hypothetical protein